MSDQKQERPDVRHLSNTDLPQATFPGGRGQSYRIYVAPEAHQAISRHGLEDMSVEICGVLVGNWRKDSDGPFLEITNSIRGESAQNKFAEVTFTHDTWADIHRQMDERFSDKSIVGWYHTHPSFGVFLSDRDRFIQENFFSNPGQVAYVVDPVRKIEGIFIWRNGKTALCPHYWIGDRIQVTPTDAASESQTEPHDGAKKTLSADQPSQSQSAEPSMLSIVTRVLAYVALFLLGYLLADMQTRWDRTRMIEGTVAHYGIWKGLRPGLEQAVTVLGDDLAVIAKNADALASNSAKSDSDSTEQLERSREVRSRVAHAKQVVNLIQTNFCLTPEESRVIESLVVDRLKVLQELDSKNRIPASPQKTDAATRENVQNSPAKKPNDEAIGSGNEVAPKNNK